MIIYNARLKPLLSALSYQDIIERSPGVGGLSVFDRLWLQLKIIFPDDNASIITRQLFVVV
jgi:hypothetical protein